MTKLKELYAASIIACCCSITAYADNYDLYGKLAVGSSFFASDPTKYGDNGYLTDKKPKASPSFGLGFGQIIDEHFRIEAMFWNLRKFHAQQNTIPDVNFLANTAGSYGTVAAPADMRYSVRSNALMFNGYYDFNNTNKFIPFVTIGIGLANNQTKPYTIAASNNNDLKYAYGGKSKNNFAYQLGAGVGYNLTDDFRVDCQYNYMDLGKFENGAMTYHQADQELFRNDDLSAKSRLKTHNVFVSLAYQFSL